MKLITGLTIVLLTASACNLKKDPVKELLGKHDAEIEDAYIKHRVSNEVKAKGKEYLIKFVDSMRKIQVQRRIKLFSMIPDTMPQRIHAWVLKHTSDKMAPYYLRLVIDKMESVQADFMVAKWYEDYANHFPKGDYYQEALFSAASKYELLGNTAKQLELLKRSVKECPDCEWAPSVRVTIDLIEKGKVNPEEQFEEIQKQNKSGS